MGRRTTIIDVAKECGLSQATVARVLNGQKDIQVKEKTRERVLKAAQKVGYRRNALAANFRRQQTNTIAISIADITNPFFPELIKGIQDKMRDCGYSVIQLNNEWNPDIDRRWLDKHLFSQLKMWAHSQTASGLFFIRDIYIYV